MSVNNWTKKQLKITENVYFRISICSKVISTSYFTQNKADYTVLVTDI